MNFGLIDHIRKLCDDNPLTSILHFLNLCSRSKDDRAFSSFIGLMNTRFPHNKSTCWEIGTRQHLHDVTRGYFWIVHNQLDGINCLTQVMRWDIGCHTNSDSSCPVNQKIWKTCRQHQRFPFAGIVIILEIYGVFIDIT